MGWRNDSNGVGRVGRGGGRGCGWIRKARASETLLQGMLQARTVACEVTGFAAIRAKTCGDTTIAFFLGQGAARDRGMWGRSSGSGWRGAGTGGG